MEYMSTYDIRGDKHGHCLKSECVCSEYIRDTTAKPTGQINWHWCAMCNHEPGAHVLLPNDSQCTLQSVRAEFLNPTPVEVNLENFLHKCPLCTFSTSKITHICCHFKNSHAGERASFKCPLCLSLLITISSYMKHWQTCKRIAYTACQKQEETGSIEELLSMDEMSENQESVENEDDEYSNDEYVIQSNFIRGSKMPHSTENSINFDGLIDELSKDDEVLRFLNNDVSIVGRSLRESQLRDLIINYLNMNNLIVPNPNKHIPSQIRWMYDSLAKALFNKFPNTQLKQGSAAKKNYLHKKERNPWTYFVHRVSVTRRFRQARKAKS